MPLFFSPSLFPPGESHGQGAVRAGLPPAESPRGGLLRARVPGGPVRHQVLARPGEGHEPAGWPLAHRTDAAVLRQVLHPRPAAARGGVHAVPVLSAGQTGPGHRVAAVQRQHRRPDGQLHRAG